MLIFERSVTKEYWLRMYRYLFRKIQRTQYTRVGGHRHILKFQCGAHYIAYAIVVKHKDEYRPIAWLYLWQKPGWKGWEVMQVFVFEKLRGQGLARRLYEAAINIDNLIMVSGKSQSKTSRALWKGFVKYNTFKMYAIDFWNMKDRSQVFWDKDHDEIWCDMDIYVPPTAPTQERDVRLIATRKKT